MLVTLFGMVTLVRLVHSLKAFSPMLVTLSGMVKTLSVFSAGYWIKVVLSSLYCTP
jgi:hypothetical protein